MPLSSMEEALEDLRAGKLLIVVDDEKRENEGDLVMAAEMVTPDAVNFLVTHGRGLLCMPMKEDRLNELGIKLIDSENAPHEMPTAFTMSGGLQGRNYHGHFRRRPGGHHPGPHRSGSQAGGIFASRAPVSAAVSSRRSIGPPRTYGGDR